MPYSVQMCYRDAEEGVIKLKPYTDDTLDEAIFTAERYIIDAFGDNGFEPQRLVICIEKTEKKNGT